MIVKLLQCYVTCDLDVLVVYGYYLNFFPLFNVQLLHAIHFCLLFDVELQILMCLCNLSF